MDRDLLYRFFGGKTSMEEENQIMQWMESAETNRIAFMEARKTYDILLFTSPKIAAPKRNERMMLRYPAGMIAAVILLLIVSALYVGTLVNKRNMLQAYNTLVVPAGQRIHLILADETDIWLNANTTLRYPSQFSENNRTVYLDGEAFFDVSKHGKRPFVVKTASGDICVSGTSFNVEAYSERETFETSLFEGNVDIYQNNRLVTTLHPDERSYLEEGKIRVGRITDRDKFFWKDGMIVFTNKTLEEIVLSIEKYFDVRIQLADSSLPQHTYTGKFRQSDGLDYALRVLQKSIQFKYERDETTGIVYIK